MAILVNCSACGTKLRVRDEYLGKEASCPSCKAPLTLQGERVPNHEVFISYSNKDKTIADAICATLEEKKIRCWIAPRDISAGHSWGGSIIDAIEDAQVMVLVYSGNSNLSRQVIREVERAVAKGLLLVPFRLEATPMSKEMEYFLSSSHWFDAMTGPLEGNLARLAETCRTLLLKSPQTKSDRPGIVPTSHETAGTKSSPWLRVGLTLGIATVLACAAYLAWQYLYKDADQAKKTDTQETAAQFEPLPSTKSPDQPTPSVEYSKQVEVNFSPSTPAQQSRATSAVGASRAVEPLPKPAAAPRNVATAPVDNSRSQAHEKTIKLNSGNVAQTTTVNQTTILSWMLDAKADKTHPTSDQILDDTGGVIGDVCIDVEWTSVFHGRVTEVAVCFKTQEAKQNPTIFTFRNDDPVGQTRRGKAEGISFSGRVMELKKTKDRFKDGFIETITIQITVKR